MEKKKKIKWFFLRGRAPTLFGSLFFVTWSKEAEERCGGHKKEGKKRLNTRGIYMTVGENLEHGKVERTGPWSRGTPPPILTHTTNERRRGECPKVTRKGEEFGIHCLRKDL